jgi:hypothetical protein
MNENTTTPQAASGTRQASNCRYVWSADGWIRGIDCEPQAQVQEAHA